jgi:hypothetical protein
MAKKRQSVDKKLTSQPAVAAATKTAKKATPAANVIWSSEKNADQTLVYGEPPPFVQVGMRRIELPDAATQKKGFFHPEAILLTRLKKAFKDFKPKGK